MEYQKVLNNIVPREYQKEIAKVCSEKNTLVILPTGLGKTLIALMVAIERITKHPLQKVLILAPTRPLAEQQKKSFEEKLPELWADIQLFTGQVKAQKRKKIWDTASIIFSTPQCIANDLKNGLYNLREVSLLVEDEAHRCVKKYDYAYIAKRYNKEAKNPRAIGLTASPGSDMERIREIAINLNAKDIQIRTRSSPDVKPYLQSLEFEKHQLDLPKEIENLKFMLKTIYDDYITYLKQKNFLFGPDNKISLINLQNRLGLQISKNIHSPESYIAMSKAAQAIKISHAIELLETQSLESFSKYLENLQSQADKKQSRGIVSLAKNPYFQKCRTLTYAHLQEGLEHPKIKQIIKIIRNERDKNPKTKIIIFTQFRETANILSRNLNKLSNITSTVFVGQAKKNGTGLSQKEQKQMIDEFKERKTNVLIATCIAEEGLDIPEVNSVIFYEPISSAIRSIQRRGRTARLSKGKLIMLITMKTKDEYAYYTSRAREKKMQSQIEKIKEELKTKGTLEDKKLIQKKII